MMKRAALLFFLFFCSGPSAVRAIDHFNRLRKSRAPVKAISNGAFRNNIDLRSQLDNSIVRHAQQLLEIDGKPPIEQQLLQIDGKPPSEQQHLANHANISLEATPSREDAKSYIRGMMLHSWNQYRERAFGHDEVTPVDGSPKDNWGHHSVTLIESLGTLWLMQLRDQFTDGVDYLDKHLIYDLDHYSSMSSFFELNIRLLGGLLGAHSACVGQDDHSASILLNLARQVGDRFLPVFQNRVLPCQSVNLASGAVSGCIGPSAKSDLAQAGTNTMEFRYLSYHTGDPKYAAVADRAMRALMKSSHQGLVSNMISVPNPSVAPGEQLVRSQSFGFSLGAEGDSYYEYLLKTFLLSCQSPQDEMYLSEWRKAMTSFHDTGYIHTIDGSHARIGVNSQEHLACFVPGMLMLADAALKNDAADIPASERRLWREIATKTATFCADAYANSPVGIGTESWDDQFRSRGGGDRWILRPEVLESIYYMGHFTGDEEWRDRSWKIAQSINYYTRQKYGFATITNVHSTHPGVENQQESFFLAETLKYLYLAHTTTDEFDPTRIVLTTEAHPLRRFCDSPSDVTVGAKDEE